MPNTIPAFHYYFFSQRALTSSSSMLVVLAKLSLGERMVPHRFTTSWIVLSAAEMLLTCGDVSPHLFLEFVGDPRLLKAGSQRHSPCTAVQGWLFCLRSTLPWTTFPRDTNKYLLHRALNSFHFR